MIQKTFLFCLLCLSLGISTSCIDLDNEMDNNGILTIDPPYEPMFQFDEQGTPYYLNTPTLSQEMQRDVQNEAIGYGWKWMQTFEIRDDGFVNPEDYYKDMIGVSPTSYYLKSDKELVRYFWSDAIPAMAFLNQGFTMDAKTGIMSDDNNPSGILPWSFYLRIWSIYKLSGRWYIDTIEPLGSRNDGTGQTHTVWGYSHYYRMSEAELKQMQKEYSFDYSQVN